MGRNPIGRDVHGRDVNADGTVDDAELEGAAELAGELEHDTRDGDIADELERELGRGDGLEPFALAAVRGGRVLVLEVLQRGGITSRVALLALERALAELEAAERELAKLEGHGARRG